MLIWTRGAKKKIYFIDVQGFRQTFFSLLTLMVEKSQICQFNLRKTETRTCRVTIITIQYFINNVLYFFFISLKSMLHIFDKHMFHHTDKQFSIWRIVLIEMSIICWSHHMLALPPPVVIAHQCKSCNIGVAIYT